MGWATFAAWIEQSPTVAVKRQAIVLGKNFINLYDSDKSEVIASVKFYVLMVYSSSTAGK